jgi:hypothetical protein
MRIDEINLVGGFSINGLTPSSGQGIGYSGSTVQWISVTGSGGGVGTIGPQGNAGPTVVTSVDVGEISFGNPDSSGGVTSSTKFTYTGEGASSRFNLVLGASGGGNRHSSGLTGFSFAFMTSNTFQTTNSVCSFISSTKGSTANGCISVIIGGESNQIGVDVNRGVVLGGENNYIKNKQVNSIIIGGESNYMKTTGPSSSNNSIIGGYKNYFENSNSIGIINNSTIIGGNSNRILGTCSTISTSNQSIIGGFCNTSANEGAVIIGGEYNNVGDGGLDKGRFSSIIGGSHNSNFGSQSSIVGMTGSLITSENTLFVDKIDVTKAIVGSASIGPNQDGWLWYDGTNLMFRTLGTDFCIQTK